MIYDHISAGKLYIDSKGFIVRVEAVNLIGPPEEQTVTFFPRFGGFAASMPVDEFKKNFSEPTPAQFASQNSWRRAWFHLDGSMCFPGIWNGQRHCGGWAVAYFEADTWRAIWKELHGDNIGGVSELHFDSDGSPWYFDDNSEEKIYMNGIEMFGVTYWNESAGWIWDAIELDSEDLRNVELWDGEKAVGPINARLEVLTQELLSYCRHNGIADDCSADELALWLRDVSGWLETHDQKRREYCNENRVPQWSSPSQLDQHVTWLNDFVRRWEDACCDRANDLEDEGKPLDDEVS